MKIKQAKKVIVILLATLLASFCLVTLIGAISFVKQNPAQNKIEAATPVVISNYNELKNFANNINNGDDDYSGKTVILDDDINCGGKNIGIGKWYSGDLGFWNPRNRFFKGIEFNGNNHTIYNFNLDVDCYYLEDGYVDAKFYGFFSCLDSSTTIINLKLSQYSISTNEGLKYTYLGGLVGYARGCTIKNCVIEDLTLDTSYSVGGIIGVGKVQASNVLVQEIKGSCKYFYGFGSCDIPYNYEMKSIYTNCVFAKNRLENKLEADKIYEYYAEGNTKLNVTIENCQTSPGEPKVSSCSTEGGLYNQVGTYWYYGGSMYNSNYPYLRQFINWYEVKLISDSKGTFDRDIVYIPCVPIRVNNQTYNIQELSNYDRYFLSAIGEYGQNIEPLIIFAEEPISLDVADGYSVTEYVIESDKEYLNGYYGLKSWKISANFESQTFNLTFKLPVLEDNDNIISSIILNNNGTNATSDIVYENVPYNTKVEYSKEVENGYDYHIFKFNLNDEENIIKYSTYDFLITSGDETIFVTQDSEIQPKFKVKTVELKFKFLDNVSIYKNGVEQSKSDSDFLTCDVRYRRSLNCKLDEQTNRLTFEFNYVEVKYSPRAGFYFESLSINGSNYTSDSLPSLLTVEDMTIIPVFKKMLDVTFDDEVENAQFSKSSALDNNNQIKIKQGESITAKYSGYIKGGGATLIYSHYDKSNKLVSENIATYTLEKFWTIKDIDQIKNASEYSDLKISPVLIFYACRVTMSEIDNDNIATMEVKTDSFEEKDGYFIVEYNTTVNLIVDYVNNTYTYKFESGEEIVYTLENNQYAILYDINDLTGERTKWYNGLNEVVDETSYNFEEEITEKTISPTFHLKQYWGNLA